MTVKFINARSNIDIKGKTTTNQSISTTVRPDANGKVTVLLPRGTYSVQPVYPEGYNILTPPITITVDNDCIFNCTTGKLS